MVQLIELFQKYVDWKILGYFLSNPTTPAHVKEIARRIKVSPGSVSTAVRRFEEDHLVRKDVKGLAHLYTLNSDNPVIRALKRAYGLFLVMDANPVDHFLKADENMLSLALFGSYATGEYDERSDIDFLVISPSRGRLAVEAAMQFQQSVGIPVTATQFKLFQWQQMAKRGDAFCLRVVQNHVLLYGSEL